MFELSSLFQLKQKLITQKGEWEKDKLSQDNKELSQKLGDLSEKYENEKGSYIKAVDLIEAEFNTLKQKHTKTLDIIESMKRENANLKSQCSAYEVQIKSLESKLSTIDRAHTQELDKIKLKQEQEKFIMSKLHKN
jgi:predicted  nucleic acid-binding Zn-ribbon protein